MLFEDKNLRQIISAQDQNCHLAFLRNEVRKITHINDQTRTLNSRKKFRQRGNEYRYLDERLCFVTVASMESAERDLWSDNSN